MTSTTAGSTMPYQTALDRTVPSHWQPQLRADLDELQRYRAAQAPVVDPDKAAAMQERAIHAGKTKVQRLHDAIDAGVKRHRLQLVEWDNTATARAYWLTRQIAAAEGRECTEDKDGRPSGWRTVYNRLKTLQL